MVLPTPWLYGCLRTLTSISLSYLFFFIRIVTSICRKLYWPFSSHLILVLPPYFGLLKKNVTTVLIHSSRIPQPLRLLLFNVCCRSGFRTGTPFYLTNIVCQYLSSRLYYETEYSASPHTCTVSQKRYWSVKIINLYKSICSLLVLILQIFLYIVSFHFYNILFFQSRICPWRVINSFLRFISVYQLSFHKCSRFV